MRLASEDGVFQEALALTPLLAALLMGAGAAGCSHDKPPATSTTAPAGERPPSAAAARPSVPVEGAYPIPSEVARQTYPLPGVTGAHDDEATLGTPATRDARKGGGKSGTPGGSNDTGARERPAARKTVTMTRPEQRIARPRALSPASVTSARTPASPAALESPRLDFPSPSAGDQSPRKRVPLVDDPPRVRILE